MELTELLYGPTGKIVSSICILVILGLMFMINVQLYMNRRKKAYFSLAVSFLLVIAQYVIILLLEMSSLPAAITAYVTQLLKVLAFIWINLGIFQLYNPTSRKVKLIVTALSVVAFVIAAMHLYLPGELSETDPILRFLAGPMLLEQYLIALILLAALFIRPNIGQTKTYLFSLGLFLLSHAIHMMDAYILEESHKILQALEHVLPVIYYTTLFFIVFNRIVELLQAVFESSIIDGLTGVYNRNYIMTYTHRLVKRRRASVIFCDIDNFKRLNDTEGHQEGDRVLKAVALILRETVGDAGKVGRYGGEEMVAVLDNAAGDVKKIAEKIRKRVEEETKVTVSVGYSRYREGVTAHELMKQADEAMYVSKKTGKNKVTAYTTRTPKMLASLQQ